MEDRSISGNPRLDILRKEVEETVLDRFRFHGWSAEITCEINHGDLIEIAASKGPVKTQLAVLYSSSGISNPEYIKLSQRVNHIFFRGSPYMLQSFARGVTIPVEPLGDFLPFLIELNKRVDPDRSPRVIPRNNVTVRRLTAENPLVAVITRLQQFTSVNLAAKLVERRAATEDISIPSATIERKATGIAYSMRNALDYVVPTSSDKLNRRVLSLYYGTIAFAQAEMLASPSGPIDLDEVEAMTKNGHGLYTMAVPNGGFSELHVGVLASGFLAEWMKFLGHNTSDYPRKKPRSPRDLDKISNDMVCTLRDLFGSMPEIEDLFAEVFGGPYRWLSVVYDQKSNLRTPALNATAKKTGSTYGLFVDRSGQIPVKSLMSAGWPLAEVRPAHDYKGTGIAFRARVDHVGFDIWWKVLPTHSSPFGKGPTILMPTVGDLRDYRAIAAVTLYALSIMVRYMPSVWRRIEGGDEDQYLALVTAALGIWERLIPQEFLESIAGETVYTAQPGSW